MRIISDNKYSKNVLLVYPLLKRYNRPKGECKRSKRKAKRSKQGAERPKHEAIRSKQKAKRPKQKHNYLIYDLSFQN